MNNPNPRVFAIVPYAPKDPYVDCCMEHLATFVDDVAKYEDRRGEMLTHEGAWRTQLLEDAVKLFKPREDDWILVNDSDEFLVDPVFGNPRVPLQYAIEHFNNNFTHTIDIARDELWQLDPAMKRIDGFWGSLVNQRIFRYRSGMSLVVGGAHLACGSVPLSSRLLSGLMGALRIVHAGYATPEDRQMRYERYKGREGHSDEHIESILKPPTLKKINYAPKIWRSNG